MELTIDQVLQKAVEAHRAGKLQEAERLYRAILQAQPKHPDANHNLGVMAVSLNKTEAALPLFKIALEANPNQGQFWLSYADALIKEKQFDNARNLLSQGKKSGLAGEKVEALEAQLTANLLTQSSETSPNKISTFTQQHKKVSTKKERKKHSSSNQTSLNQARSPAQVQLTALLEHYQKGRYELAQNLATTLTHQYPHHPLGWKVLGTLFKQTGKLQDSVSVNQKVLEISPHDAGAHYNLGNTLKELGRLQDAETSYKKAIAIKPDLAEAHCNLGSTLRELGKLEDAELSYNKAIAIKPDYADAHSNLGGTLKDLGRLEDAELSYKNAIEIKPDFATAILNRAMLRICQNQIDDSIDFLKKIIEIDSSDLSLIATVKLAILNFMADDLYTANLLIENSKEILQSKNKSLKNDAVYHILMDSLISWHRMKRYPSYEGFAQSLHVIGESHAMPSNRLYIESLKGGSLCKVHWIADCKQWHLGNSSRNHYKEQFERVLHSLPYESTILLSIGEIDCRLDDGILKHIKKHPSKNQSALIKSTIENYLLYVYNATYNKSNHVIIQGVPCPNIDPAKVEKNDLSILIEFIKIFNYELRAKSKKIGFEFLDLHELTDRGDGYSNGVWNIDNCHLSPAGMLQAWKRHLEFVPPEITAKQS
jgi:tetratricopeptide (TPR) repeat protein